MIENRESGVRDKGYVAVGSDILWVGEVDGFVDTRGPTGSTDPVSG